MNLTSKEQKILSIYQNWLKENNLSNKCNAYFIEQNSCLVFQVWDLEKQISESVWLKLDNCKWQYYIKNLDEKFNKFFSLKEILELGGGFMQKVDGKDIMWFLGCKDCSKTLKFKDVKETIKADFKMCDKHLEMIEKKYNKQWNIN